MKKCKKCGKLKELDDFPKAKENKDGYSNSCSTCKSEYMKKYRSENKKKY